MAETAHFPDEVPDRPESSIRRSYYLKVVAWMILIAGIILVLSGLTGAGPYSHVNASTELLKARMEKVLRYKRTVEMPLTVKPVGQQAIVMMNSEFLASVQLERITPEPEKTLTGRGKVAFLFPAAGNGEIEIMFYFKPVKIGRETLVIFDGRQDSVHTPVTILP